MITLLIKTAWLHKSTQQLYWELDADVTDQSAELDLREMVVYCLPQKEKQLFVMERGEFEKAFSKR